MGSKKQKEMIPSQQEESRNRGMMSESDSESVSLPRLPHDTIIYDILTRVPIDSLMRFRCVCKSWSNLTINDSVFINLHLRRRQAYSERGLIWLFPSEDDDSANSDDADDDDDDDVAGTKSAGYSYKLPVRNEFVRGIDASLWYHLAYDSVMEKYKVLCLRYQPIKISLKIVTLETENDSWRDVDFPKVSPLRRGGVFANGCVHWMTRCDDILSIDVSKEVLYTIKYPKGGSKYSCLLEVEGSLCFLDYIIYNGFNSYRLTENLKLWVLKEDEEKKNDGYRHEWILVLNTHMFHGIVPRAFVPEGFFHSVGVAFVMHPTPKIIFRVPDPKGESDFYYRYKSYDVKLKKFNSIAYDIHPTRKASWLSKTDDDMHCKWHVGSLAHL